MPARPPLFDDVALALLRGGQPVRFRAAGLSMEPSIRDGDAITVSPAGIGELRPGDVLLYRAGGRLLAHRLIGPADARGFTLRVRADAPGWEEERVSVGDVVGRIDRVERSGRIVRNEGQLMRRLTGLARRLRRRLSGIRTAARAVRSRAHGATARKR